MKISCIGDVGIDSYVSMGKTFVGGTSFNIATQLVSLCAGTNDIFLLSAIGTDSNAQVIQSHILCTGIDSILLNIVGSSPVQEIAVDPIGEKKFVKYNDGVLANWSLDSSQENRIKNSDVIIASLFRQIEHVVKQVLQIQRKGITIIDFSDLSDYEKSSKIVEENINSIDIAFFGLIKQDKRLINLLEKISAENDKLIVVTLGENGAIAFKGREKYSCTPPRDTVNVIDTTGAGDCFLASFMYKYLEKEDIQQCLDFASWESAKQVAILGAN